jgi:hypothetical protein
MWIWFHNGTVRTNCETPNFVANLCDATQLGRFTLYDVRMFDVVLMTQSFSTRFEFCMFHSSVILYLLLRGLCLRLLPPVLNKNDKNYIRVQRPKLMFHQLKECCILCPSFESWL